MVCLSESKTFPEFKELRAIFETGKLDQGIATEQFDEELPQIASDLITADFNARNHLRLELAWPLSHTARRSVESCWHL